MPLSPSLPRGARRAARALALVGAAAALMITTACGGSDDADAADGSDVVLRVGVQKDGIRPFLEQSGLLDDAPYTIEWSEFTAGPPLVEAAAADKIDVAWVGSAPPIFGAAGDARFKVVAAFQERDHKENSILVPKGSAITDVKDLKGKKVAVGRGTSAHGLLLNALSRNGLTLDDIEVSYLAPPDGLAAFSSGAVDAWVVWDPFVTQAVQEEGAVEIAGGAPDEQALQFEIASSASLDDEDQRDAIADFVGRLQKGFAWAIEHSDTWGEAWAAESGLPESTTKVVAKNKASDVGPVTDDVVAAQQKLADAFYEAGELPKKVDFASIVEPGLID